MKQRRRATCVGCRTDRAVTTSGMIIVHPFGKNPECSGSGRRPLEDDLIALIQDLPVSQSNGHAVLHLADVNAAIDQITARMGARDD